MMLLFLLIAGALLTRVCRLPLVFGQELAFSSIFLYILLYLYGTRAAIAAALMVNAVMLLYRGFEPELFLYLLEACLVSLAFYRFKRLLLLFDALFWCMVAVPLTVLYLAFYQQPVTTGTFLYLFIFLINGLFNALLAEAAATYLPLRNQVQMRYSSKTIGFSKILFHLAAFSIIAPFLLFTVINSWNAEKAIHRNAYEQVRAKTNFVLNSYLQWPSEDKQALKLRSVLMKAHMKNILLSVSQSTSLQIALLDKNRQLLTDDGNIAGINLQKWRTGGSVTTLSTHFYQYIPRQRILPGVMNRWDRAFFMYEYPLDGMRLLIRIPVQMYRDEMYTSYFIQFSVILACSFLIMLFALFLNRVIIQSLNRLAGVTSDLPVRLKALGDISLPKSSIREISTLTTNFQAMLDSLSTMVRELQQVNSVLKAQTEQLQISEGNYYTLAHYDVLTGLPNRLHFMNHLKKYLDEARESGKPVKIAILLIDLDRFKHINDTLGHSIGDLLLQAIANRLKQLADALGFFTARLGGDEFIVMLEQTMPEYINRTAESILQQLNSVVTVQGYELRSGASIGISLYPDDGDTITLLLSNADASMYEAKGAGGNSYYYYSRHYHRAISNKLYMENGMYKALEEKEFLLHYQPILNAETGRIAGVEALIRWRHPEHGFIMPDEFIPVVEETGLITLIGEWVLREACRQIAKWEGMGFGRLRVNVNWSARQFQQQDMDKLIETVLQETGLEASALELEITEGYVIKNTEQAIKKLKRVQDMGATIAIDDFGNGYSALSLLKSLPINCLKIDKSFVRGIPADAGNMAIIRAVTQMAHDMGLTVTAEGVETLEQMQYLKKLKCDELQGYYIGKPMPQEALEDLLLTVGQADRPASEAAAAGESL